MRRLIALGLVVFVAIHAHAANAELLKEATELAESIKYLRANLSIHRAQKPIEPKPLRRFVSLARMHDESDWWELTKHQSARIRSLAICAISWKDNPKSLHRMLPLLYDKATSFLKQEYAQSASTPPWDVEQTVGEFAKAHVDKYMAAAGFRWGIQPGSSGSAGFTEYWEPRKNRDECFSWLSVSLSRADQSYWGSDVDPIQSEQLFHAIRKRIDTLPFPDRQWTLLGLSTPTESGKFDQHGDLLATHADRIEAAIALGSERLINMLQNQIVSQDPDIHWAKTNGIYPSYPLAKVRYWILQHAQEIFQPADADKILRVTSTIEAHLTAAKLSPHDASRFLNAALDLAKKKHRADAEHARLYVALWQHQGHVHQNDILDWFFFANAKYVGDIKPITELLRQPTGRSLLKVIWMDERCESMDWDRLTSLLNVSRPGGQNPLVSLDEMNKARSAFGGQDFAGKGGRPKTYVRDPATIKKHIADWRARALASFRNEQN